MQKTGESVYGGRQGGGRRTQRRRRLLQSSDSISHTTVVVSALTNGKHSVLKEEAGAAVLTTAGGPVKQVEEVQIGWMTEAKDWAGELISGQSMTGRILVSCLLVCPAPSAPRSFILPLRVPSPRSKHCILELNEYLMAPLEWNQNVRGRTLPWD